MRMDGDDIWKERGVVYHKMGLSEDEIAKRMLCKTIKIIERKNNLEKCDEK